MHFLVHDEVKEEFFSSEKQVWRWKMIKWKYLLELSSSICSELLIVGGRNWINFLLNNWEQKFNKFDLTLDLFSKSLKFEDLFANFYIKTTSITLIKTLPASLLLLNDFPLIIIDVWHVSNQWKFSSWFSFNPHSNFSYRLVIKPINLWEQSVDLFWE